MNRAAPIVAVLALAAPAHADRSTVTAISLIGADTARGSSFGDAGNRDAHSRLGSRLTLSFEDDALAIPPPGLVTTELRLVPELLAGFLANDTHAEGMIGAGLRAELHIASHRRDEPTRHVIYTAARADVIGKHQDGAAELAIGSYILGREQRRFGWELGMMLRPRPYADPSRAFEFDGLVSFYVGWRP